MSAVFVVGLDLAYNEITVNGEARMKRMQVIEE